MADDRQRDNLRHIFHTRASVLAAWFISIVVVWPILWSFLAITGLFCVWAILTTLDPGPWAQEAIGMEISFVWMGPIMFFSAVVTGIACYKTCRYLTASWRESKPLAFETGTLMTVSIAVVVAFAFWKYLVALMAVP